jgi:hypothetical protein
MSMTCAHRCPASSAPSRDPWQDRHSAGGSAVLASVGSGSRFRPFPWWPGCPPRLRSSSRSRSDSCRSFFSRALRSAFAPMPSFEDGVPESELSMFSRRSSSAIRRSCRRIRSTAASRRDTVALTCASRTEISSSLAAMTPRSRRASD